MFLKYIALLFSVLWISSCSVNGEPCLRNSDCPEKYECVAEHCIYTTDVSDIKDISDTSDATDISDISDATDISDTSDASDISDTSDATDISKSIDLSRPPEHKSSESDYFKEIRFILIHI